MFYWKLGFGNLRKNWQTYLPFWLALTFLVAINTMTQIIIRNKGISKLKDGPTAAIMFYLGGLIIIIFSVIFALYTNGFLLKQRKKELGLYNVLGLGKRELYKLLAIENLFSFLLVLFLGVVSGSIFAKLGFLILRKLFSVETYFVFSWPIDGMMLVLFTFFVLFLLLYFINCLQIFRMNPIELLQAGKKGEKEPKTKGLIAFLGIIELGAGYTIAITIKSPLDALSLFFIAVILVILGTYQLFSAGSIVFLKLLRKNQHYYYKPNHFINVSSMLYRMKQNAVGLASICILSTMVLVTVATTASLLFGQKDVIATRYPTDISITTTDNPEKIKKAITHFSTSKAVTLTKWRSIKSTPALFFREKDNNFQIVHNLKNVKNTTTMTFITGKTYQQLSGKKALVGEKEVIAFAMYGKLPKRTISFRQHTFTIKKEINQLAGFPNQGTILDTFLIVMKDQQTINKLLGEWFQTKEMAENKLPMYTFSFNFHTPAKMSRTSFAKSLKTKLEKLPASFTLESKDTTSESAKVLNGGFFFLGIMFGTIFMFATALIIYYKQITEGMDDQERFNILQKVGMSHNEVKKVIHSQILMVFAFPLLVALIHLGFAFPLIRKLLILFGLTNWHFFLGVTCVIAAIFGVLYFIVYQMTAKMYYRMVER